MLVATKINKEQTMNSFNGMGDDKVGVSTNFDANKAPS